MPLFHVIIPAAGNGSRMGEATPKQYLQLHQQALIQYVVDVFSQSTHIASTHIVLSPEDTAWQAAKIQICHQTQVHYCGGTSRAESVLNGLEAIQSQVNNEDWILVHDAARPGLSQELLNHLIESLQDTEVGGLLALPLADTLKKADATSLVIETIPRDHLWQAQTPQMFRYATLKRALASFDGTPTDEAQAIERLGLQPVLVRGDLRNLKVTYPQDLVVLNALLGNEENL